MNLLTVVVALVLVALIPVFVALAIDRARHRSSRTRPAFDPTLVPDQHVQFESPPRRGRRGRQQRFLPAGLLIVYGIWAAALTIHGAPVLGPIAALVLFELALASYRAASITGGVIFDEAIAARVAPLLANLCGRAGCPVPGVALRDDAVRVAGVRRFRNRTTVVLSRAFVDEVSDPELEAILAHEVVHIARGDLGAARRRALFCVFVGTAAGLGSAFGVQRLGFGGFPIYFAAFVLATIVSNVATAPLNRPKEARADLEGARLACDPASLARALATADAMSKETRARLYGALPWRWLLYPLSWRMPTHPRMSKRIARLEELAKAGVGLSGFQPKEK